MSPLNTIKHDRNNTYIIHDIVGMIISDKTNVQKTNYCIIISIVDFCGKKYFSKFNEFWYFYAVSCIAILNHK